MYLFVAISFSAAYIILNNIIVLFVISNTLSLISLMLTEECCSVVLFVGCCDALHTVSSPGLVTCNGSVLCNFQSTIDNYCIGLFCVMAK